MKTTTPPSAFLGIDVGKADLYCHLLLKVEPVSARFDNNKAGIRKLTAWLTKQCRPEELAACLEQTGHYGRGVADALFGLGTGALYLINPRQIKAFANQRLRRNKSDTADARLIAKFVYSDHLQLRPWQPRSACQDSVTSLGRYAAALTADTAKLKTRLESATCDGTRKSLLRRIAFQEKELAGIRAQIADHISGDDTLTERYKLLETIPGLGEITCQTLLAELPEIELFGCARQLAAWAGVTPRHHVSGTSGRPTTPITKVGSANLRRALFFPAMNAKKFNPLLEEFAGRLKENGKTGKQIVVAVMRKLLHQIYGVLKSGEPFDPDKRGFKHA